MYVLGGVTVVTSFAMPQVDSLFSKTFATTVNRKWFVSSLGDIDFLDVVVI